MEWERDGDSQSVELSEHPQCLWVKLISMYGRGSCAPEQL